MRKLYLPFICLLFALSLHAQDRVNKPLPTLGDTIGYLDSAKGWQLFTDGQWVSKPNRIPLNTSDFEESGEGADNFKSLLLQDIKIGDSIYCVLFKPYKDGVYEYPSIQKGWVDKTSTAYFLFSKSRLKALSRINGDTQCVIRIPLISYDDLKLFNSTKSILSVIASYNITGRANDSNRLCIVLRAWPEKNIAQFFISEESVKPPFWGSSPRYNYECVDNDKISLIYQGDNEDFLGNTLLLKQFYYETSWDNFRKLFGAGK